MTLGYALRRLRRQPGLTLTAVLTLALGIGANITIFTFTNAALFRPMPGIADADRLIWVSSSARPGGGMAYADFIDYREAMASAFSDLAALRAAPLSLGSGGEPERIKGHLVTGSYFATLGAAITSGRTLGEGDDRPASAPVAVMSYRLWQQRFGGAPDTVASTIIVNGQQVIVVGIAPEHFVGPVLGDPADLWLPVSTLPLLRPAEARLLEEREAASFLVLGRLRPGVTIGEARAASLTVAARLDASRATPASGPALVLTSVRSGLSPGRRSEIVPLSSLLLAVTGIVLLIACANIANLMLARNAGRAFEMRVRAALGASRGRLVRELLAESFVLSVGGAAAGLLLSFWVTDLLLSRLPEVEFRGLPVAPDVRVLTFASLAGLASVCVFGLAPALTATSGALLSGLREAPHAGARSRTQRGFVVAQLALSLVLLLAGGLSLRAIQKASRIDVGFDPTNVLAASYDLGLQNYTSERRAAFRRELRARLAALPGVTGVGAANVAPLSGTMIFTGVAASDDSGTLTEARASLNGVDAGYFDALRIRIVEGRRVGAADVAGAPSVAVVNQTMAERFWGATGAVGRTVVVGDTRFEVVGTARDAKYDEATERPVPFMYVSIDQHPQLDRETVLVRASSATAALASAIRSEIRLLDPALPVFDLKPLESLLRERIDRERGVSVLLAMFGLAALLLAVLGVYGVVTCAVARRTREFGVRIALGARPSQLVGRVLRDSLGLLLLSAAVGTVLSVPLAFAVGALLFGIQIADVLAIALSYALLAGAGLAASYLPARRASRVDPVVALRSE